MGIDIFLSWKGMKKKDKQRQAEAIHRIDGGNVGYLREAYRGGPYPSKILVREAFEAPKCEAKIPASLLRHRLTHVTEPAVAGDAAHAISMIMQELARRAKSGQMPVDGEVIKIDASAEARGRTEPMTVEEAIRKRCQIVYPDMTAKDIEILLASYAAFVELAEQKEKETGKPCTIHASY